MTSAAVPDQPSVQWPRKAHARRRVCRDVPDEGVDLVKSACGGFEIALRHLDDVFHDPGQVALDQRMLLFSSPSAIRPSLSILTPRK